MSGEQAEPQSWWKRLYHCGPLKSFALAALLGAVSGTVVGLLIDHRDVPMLAMSAVLCAAVGGIVGSTLALHVNYPVWSKRYQAFSGFLLLVSIAVGLHFGVLQAAANSGLLVFLVVFGDFIGLIHFTVCGMCGVVLGIVCLRNRLSSR